MMTIGALFEPQGLAAEVSHEGSEGGGDEDDNEGQDPRRPRAGGRGGGRFLGRAEGFHETPRFSFTRRWQRAGGSVGEDRPERESGVFRQIRGGRVEGTGGGSPEERFGKTELGDWGSLVLRDQGLGRAEGGVEKAEGSGIGTLASGMGARNGARRTPADRCGANRRSRRRGGGEALVEALQEAAAAGWGRTASADGGVKEGLEAFRDFRAASEEPHREKGQVARRREGTARAVLSRGFARKSRVAGKQVFPLKAVGLGKIKGGGPAAQLESEGGPLSEGESGQAGGVRKRSFAARGKKMQGNEARGAPMEGEAERFGGLGGGVNLIKEEEGFRRSHVRAQAAEGVEGPFAGQLFDEGGRGGRRMKGERGEEMGIAVGGEGRPGFFKLGKQERGREQVGRGEDLDVDGAAGAALGAAKAIGVGSVGAARVEGEVVAKGFSGFSGVRKQLGEGKPRKEGSREAFWGRREFGGKIAGAALHQGAELFESTGVVRRGGREDGVE